MKRSGGRRQREMTTVGIKQRVPAQHGAQHGQQAIRDAAQGAPVRVSAGTQVMIVLAADRVMLHAAPRPMLGGVAHPVVAGLAHPHQRSLTALAGDWRDAGIGAQGVVVSLGEGLCGLGQHRGGDHTSHSR